MEGLSEPQGADIDEDDFGKIFRQALNMKKAKAMLKQSAIILDAVGFSRRLDRNLGVENLIGGHFEKIDMENIAPNGVMLDFLNQGQLA